MSDLSKYENDLRSLLLKVYAEGYKQGFEDHKEIIADIVSHDIKSIKFKEDDKNGRSESNSF